jgi:hypothetical protein
MTVRRTVAQARLQFFATEPQPGPVVQATRSFTCEKGQTYE